MRRFFFPLVAAVSVFSTVQGQTLVASDPKVLIEKIQDELAQPPPSEEGKVDPSVPHGEFLRGTIVNPALYPGTEREFQVYVPAQYHPEKPACLLLKLDGMSNTESNVLDNLIAKKELPVIIGVGINPGAVWTGPTGTPRRQVVRYDRSYEFDSTNDHFSEFVLNELLPAVQKLTTHDGRAIRLSPAGNDHAAMGASTGGIGSFTLAWQRPDQFSRVYDTIGTFVSMRGGNDYPSLIRKTDPKPLRVFLEDGSTDAWNPLFGSWYDANLNMESALSFAGYEVAHAWGTHGHDDKPGQRIFPDVMRWLWHDYPKPVSQGVSTNSTLQEIELPGEDWQKISHSFQAATGLAANPQGEVFLSDTPAATIFRLGVDGQTTIAFRSLTSRVTGEAFGPDGVLYALLPDEKKVVSFDPQGAERRIAEGIVGHGIAVNQDRTIYVSEPGEHGDMPSQIWQVKPDGEKKLVDQGLSAASGIAFSPDGTLFFAAENSTKWIYSFVVRPDGVLADKQPFYWLHMTDLPNSSGAEDLAVDTHGNLYAATRMGVQVCDQNGRVRAILPLPTPCGPVRSLCFGGLHLDVLYATDGAQVFRRRLKLPGLAPWAARASFPSQGGG